MGKGKKCEVCKRHKATELFSENMLSYIHGQTEELCLCCLVKRQEGYVDQCKENLKILQKRLKEEGCK